MSFDNEPQRFQLGINNSHNTVPLVLLTPETTPAYMKNAGARERAFLRQRANHPNDAEDWIVAGRMEGTYISITSNDDNVPNPYNFMYALSENTKYLRAARYCFTDKIKLKEQQLYNLALGWGLGAYRFSKKTTKPEEMATLVIPKNINQKRLMRELNATAWAQDLMNEGSSTLHAWALAAEALTLAKRFNAKATVTSGHKLEKNYPLVYAVGKGARADTDHAPRLVDLRWGEPDDPAIVLVGKGVAFDAGGLNWKDDSGMQTMKHDMAGAAHAMAVARMIMDAELPVNLRVLLPIVENFGGAAAYRQGDYLTSRSGKTIEIVNTDAEGRLLMSDALYEASHPSDGEPLPKPKLIVDFATLSWHGESEFPGFGSVFGNKPGLAEKFLRACRISQEYFTGRPHLSNINQELDSQVADMRQCNSSHGRYDDLLAAALLRRFVDPKIDWLHTDLQAWRSETDEATKMPAGLAPGGFAQGIRSAYRFIEQRFSEPGL